MRVKQESILGAAATLVKPGGRLVYATCSLLVEESEDIVAAFLANNSQFGLLNCSDLLRQHGVGIDWGEQMRLWPHIHGTDGFFAAVLERVKKIPGDAHSES
jgi:16S rRNA (cytosine967-C5)-methyltransferase